MIGEEIRIARAAVTHGSLTVSITEDPAVSQPNPFGEGETVVTEDTDIGTEEAFIPMFVFDTGVTLEALVKAVNDVGASPGDLISILEALKNAGAMQAELVVI